MRGRSVPIAGQKVLDQCQVLDLELGEHIFFFVLNFPDEVFDMWFHQSDYLIIWCCI